MYLKNIRRFKSIHLISSFRASRPNSAHADLPQTGPGAALIEASLQPAITFYKVPQEAVVLALDLSASAIDEVRCIIGQGFNDWTSYLQISNTTKLMQLFH